MPDMKLYVGMLNDFVEESVYVCMWIKFDNEHKIPFWIRKKEDEHA